MQGNIIVIHHNAPGQLAADSTSFFSLPFGVTLIGANGKCDNGDSFLLNFGTPADPDAYIDDATVTGAAATTVDVASSALVDGAPMHIAANTELLLTVDHDGGDGDDAANVTVCLFFREG